ncbi:MAG: LPS export ABC transporter periplasmic protein LptC [Bauldia sp.]|nr:LPS export ABC transporter periplasmic protein LptC [Bauldia sp.]
MNQPYSPPQSRAALSGSRIAVAPARRDHAGAKRHSRRVGLLRIALPVAALAGVALYVSTLRGGGETEAPPADPPALTEEILADEAMVMQAPRMAGFQEDGRPYRIEAERAMQRADDADLIELETVRAAFTLDDSDARVTADRGVYDSAGAMLTLDGRVTITTDAGLSARFENAEIALDTGTITSDEPVAIESDGRVIRGNRLVITEGGDALSLTDGVILTAAEPAAAQPAGGDGMFGSLGGGGSFEISADSLEQVVVDGRPRFTFSGEVAAVRGDTTITAPTMVVSAPPGAEGSASFDRMVASGGVTIDAGGRRVTGTDAEVDLAANTLRVTGGTTIRDGESRLSGGTMRADMAAGTVMVEGGRVRFFSPGAGGGGGGGGGAFGAFRTGSGGPTEIVADRFSQTPRDGGGALLTFSGNVVADRGGSIVRAPTLTVLVPGGAGGAMDSASFERIEASGGVEVRADRQTATGANAVFNMAAGTIVMTGAVSVTDGNQTLSGDRLTVDMNSGVMTMEPLTRAIITPRGGAGLP